MKREKVKREDGNERVLGIEEIQQSDCKGTERPMKDSKGEERQGVISQSQTQPHIPTHLEAISLLGGGCPVPLNQVIVRAIQFLVQLYDERLEE